LFIIERRRQRFFERVGRPMTIASRRLGRYLAVLLFWCRRLRMGRRGVEAVEFALVSSLFLVFGLVALDFGLALIAKLRLASAVSQGQLYAFDAYANSQTMDPGTIQSYVTSVSNIPTIGVTVTCNGTSSCSASSASCYCLAVSPLGYTPASSCSATCAAGGAPGYFMTVATVYAFHPMVSADIFLAGSMLGDSATMRLR
jgi:Flp pilus assembly protein TadG